jgi:peptide/nickel transport system substrate-binding protein
VGALAMTSVLSADRMRLELTIRPDALFADGSRIMAADVVASLTHAWEVQREGDEAWRWENVETIELGDRDIAAITLRQPDASIPALLASWRTPILPQSWIATFAGQADPEIPPSSGTFQVQSVTDSRIRFRRNDGYYQVGRPRLKGVTCVAPSSAISRTTDLVADDVDLLIDAPLLDIPTLRENPRITLVGGPTNRLCLLQVNLRRPRLADQRMRTLISSAINREDLVRAATAGEAVPASSLVPAGHWAAFDTEIVVAAPDDIRTQLQALGEPPGMELRLIASSRDASLANACLLLQEQFAWAGIALALDLLDDAELDAAMTEGDWDLQMTYMPWWRDPHELFRPLVVSDGAMNASGYASNRVDYLAGLACRARAQSERGYLYSAIQEIIGREAPVIPLFFPNHYDAMNGRLESYPFYPPESAAAMAQVTMRKPEPIGSP